MKPAAPPRPADAAARARIVQYARRHFFLHGFRTVTMDDLAAELGVSKKTLYAHFPSKDALVEAVIRAKFNDLDTDLRRITSGEDRSLPGALQRLLEASQAHLGEIQPSFVRDLRRESPEIFRLIQSLRQECVQLHFGRLFHAGRRAGLVRKDVPPAVIIAILLGAVEAIMNPEALDKLKLTPKVGFMSILTVVLQGALTPQGKADL